MKKCFAFTVLTIVLTVSLLGGCASRQEAENPAAAETERADGGETETDDPEEMLMFSASLNVCSTDSGEPVEYKITADQKQLYSVSLASNVTPDRRMPHKDIPLRIWVVEDGMLAESALDGNGDFQLFHDIAVDADKEQRTDVAFYADNHVKFVTILCLYLPEYIQEKGSGDFNGVITYSMRNTAYQEGTAQEPAAAGAEYYADVSPNQNSYGADIGKKRVEENAGRVVEPHIYEDVQLSGGEELYAKLNTGAEVPYDVFILYDGNMVSCFDGSVSCRVDNAGGTQTFQYPVAGAAAFESGLHAVQLIALASESRTEDGSGVDAWCSSKVRIQYSEE